MLHFRITIFLITLSMVIVNVSCNSFQVTYEDINDIKQSLEGIKNELNLIANMFRHFILNFFWSSVSVGIIVVVFNRILAKY
jgi:hypothetical protein